MAKLNAPKQVTLLISFIFVAVGIAVHLLRISVIAPYAIWAVVAGWLILAAGTVLKGL